MELEAFTKLVFIWVSQYIAGFSMISIAMWAVGMYLWGKEWQNRVRDAGIFMLAIGVPTIILALRPAKLDIVLWPPLIWFCFTMLIVLELLWLSYLIDALTRAVRGAATRARDAAESITGNPLSR